MVSQKKSKRDEVSRKEIRKKGTPCNFLNKNMVNFLFRDVEGGTRISTIFNTMKVSVIYIQQYLATLNCSLL